MVRVDKIMNNVITPKVKNGYPVYSPAAGPLFAFEKSDNKQATIKMPKFISKVTKFFRSK